MLHAFMSCVCFFKHKTAYEMRMSDWSSDVCSSDLHQMIGADGIFVVRAAGDAFVLDAVNLLVVERRGEIDPVVGDDARVHRPHTGEDGGMTDAGDRKSTRLNSSH